MSTATTTTTPLQGQATDEQIAAWKAKYPLGIYAIKVDGHIGYFKMPDFNEINFGFSKLDQDSITDMWLAFAESTLLGGSDEILKNATLFSGAMKVLQKQVDGKKAELVEL